MDTKKLVLLEQISKEIKAGSTTTLVSVINLLTDKQISDNYTQETKDYLLCHSKTIREPRWVRGNQRLEIRKSIRDSKRKIG